MPVRAFQPLSGNAELRHNEKVTRIISHTAVARSAALLCITAAAHVALFVFTPPIMRTAYIPDGLLAQIGVGMSAGVAENPLSALAGELSEKELELRLREAELAERERRNEDENVRRDALLAFSYVMTALLAALVAVNFMFDYKERKMERSGVVQKTA